MRTIIIALAVCMFASAAFAKGGGRSGGHSGSHSSGKPGASKSSGGTHTVRGYTRKDGKYVQPHRQTNPDKSKTNNWSSKGNSNPDTGKQGTVDPNKP